jgi:hypothetical protein
MAEFARTKPIVARLAIDSTASWRDDSQSAGFEDGIRCRVKTEIKRRAPTAARRNPPLTSARYGARNCAFSEILITFYWSLERGQAFANAVFGESRDASNFELVHDLLAMGFHRLHAQLESRSNIFGGSSFGD